MYCCNTSMFAGIVYVNSFCCIFFYFSFVYENMMSNCIMYKVKIILIDLYINNNNNISLLQTHGPYTYKKNVKHT